MQPLRIAHLGARGSFSEEAAATLARRWAGPVALHGSEALGSDAPAAVLEALASGAVERAVLPLANSSAGLVRSTLAALLARPCELEDELVLPVRLSLCAVDARGGADELERVASHPMALAQCTRTLARLLPGRPGLPWSDTAAAARDLARGALPARTAVLCSARAAELYGLAVLAHDVQDASDNRTFFAVLRRSSAGALE
jgi:prephenate dehydratase